jgi:zinc transport system permease protein
MADALSHVALVGVAVGVFSGTSPVLFSIITAMLAAVAIERLRAGERLFGDTALALFLSGSLAVAVVLMSIGRGSRIDLSGILFGSVSTVTPHDLFVMAILAGCVLATLVLFRREFFLVVLDPEVARAEGVPAARYTMLIALLAAVTVAITMRIVGALLIGGLMVIPVVTALQYRRGFATTLLLAVFCSLVATVVGLGASFALDLAPGGTIVLAALLLLVGSLAATRGR